MGFRSQKILIFGATGFIGKRIADAILDANLQFEKIGMFTSTSSLQRKADQFESYKTKGAEIITGDIDSEEAVLEAYKGFDTVVSALGREAIIKQIGLVRLAEESTTIRRFFPSEYGTDIEYSEASTHEAAHQTKLAVRRYFRDHVRRLEHTYLMTGPYGDGYVALRPPIPEIGSFHAETREAYVVEPRGQKIAWTAMTDVGRFVVAALLHSDVSRNRALKVTSYIASQDDILAEFEKQTASRWKVHETSAEGLAAYEKQAWKDNSPLATPCSLRRLWLRGETIYPEFDNAALGNPSVMSLASVVEQNLTRLKA